MIIYCRVHGEVMGVVDHHPGNGLAELRYRDPRWRQHHAALAGVEGRHNSRAILEDRAVTRIVAGGCASCGPRELPIKDLLDAFAAELPKITA